MTKDSALETPSPSIVWESFADLHHFLSPPLRPSASDLASFRSALVSNEDNVLMLGVTPELTQFGQRLTAADLSGSMIARVWPGDDSRQRAVLADWMNLPFEDAAFSAVIGDGSLSSAGDNILELLQECRRVLRPGGVAAFRTFCAPSHAESLAQIRADVVSGWSGNFHALKFRIAMAVAASSPSWSVPVQEIRRAFDTVFPDRVELARITEYGDRDISTIDFYKQADHTLVFTGLETLIALAEEVFGDVRVIAAQGYPLSARCPLLIAS